MTSPKTILRSEVRLLSAALLIFVALLPVQLSLESWVDYAIVALGYCALFALCRLENLSLTELHLDRGSFRRGLIPSLIIMCGTIGILTIAYNIDSTLFHDNRYNKSLSEALGYAFIVIPLRTVLIEEIMFRGVLLSAFHKFVSLRNAIVASSVMFGLWHVLSSRNVTTDLLPEFLHEYEHPLMIVGIVIATTTAGLALSYLRIRYKSLFVPITLHWAINSVSVIFAYFAWR